MIPHFVTAPFLVFSLHGIGSENSLGVSQLGISVYEAEDSFGYVNTKVINNVYEIDTRLEMLSLIAP